VSARLLLLRRLWPDNNLTERIPYTQRCTEALAHAYTTVPIILASVNDTLVFLAISYRMVSLSLDSSTWTGKAKSFIMGDGLQHLSKALLHSVQAYYLSVFCFIQVDIPWSN
jgi:hypothetical protein